MGNKDNNPYCNNEIEEIAARRGAVGMYKPTEQDEIWFKACAKAKQEKLERERDEAMMIEKYRSDAINKRLADSYMRQLEDENISLKGSLLMVRIMFIASVILNVWFLFGIYK